MGIKFSKNLGEYSFSIMRDLRFLEGRGPNSEIGANL